MELVIMIFIAFVAGFLLTWLATIDEKW